jgi:hypothetical protein
LNLLQTTLVEMDAETRESVIADQQGSTHRSLAVRIMKVGGSFANTLECRPVDGLDVIDYEEKSASRSLLDATFVVVDVRVLRSGEQHRQVSLDSAPIKEETNRNVRQAAIARGEKCVSARRPG